MKEIFLNVLNNKLYTVVYKDLVTGNVQVKELLGDRKGKNNVPSSYFNSTYLNISNSISKLNIKVRDMKVTNDSQIELEKLDYENLKRLIDILILDIESER
jgi:hypothetical protein